MTRTPVTRLVRLVPLALLFTLLSVAPAMAQSGLSGTPKDPAALIENASTLDGEVVRLSGEIIGDRLHSGDAHVWINVLGDEGVAIGVWVPREETAGIEHYGDYFHVGDRVVIAGVLNEACDDHGGDLDVHSTAFEIVQSGHTVERPAEPVWAILGGIGIAAAVVLQRIGRRRRLRAPGTRG